MNISSIKLIIAQRGRGGKANRYIFMAWIAFFGHTLSRKGAARMDQSGKSVLVLTVLSALAQAVGFFYRVVMARMVGAEVMGLYQLVMSAYAVIQAVTTVGLTAALSNLTARYLALNDPLGAHRVRGRCLRLFFLLMLPVGVVTVTCSDAISVHLLGDARTQLGLILLIPCLTLTGIENLHKNAFYGAARPIPPAVAEVWEQLVRAAAVLGLLALFLPQYPERAVGLVMWGMILCEVSSALTLWTMYRQVYGVRAARGVREKLPLRQIAAIALPVGANALLGNLLGAANSALAPRQLVRSGMERSLAISRLGVVCGMTLPMIALPTVYLGALNLVMMPRLARATALGQKGVQRELIAQGMERVCMLTVPCMTAMAVLGEPLGRLLYGREDVGDYVIPLVWAMGINCCVSVLATALNSISYQQTVAFISLAGGGVQVGCTFFLTGLPGVEMGGYAAGMLLSAVLELVLCLWAVCRHTGLRPRLWRWLRAPGLSAALAGSTAGLLLRVCQKSGMNGWGCVGLVLAFFAAQYLTAVGLFGKGHKEIDKNA